MNIAHLNNFQIQRLYNVMREMNHLLDEGLLDGVEDGTVLDWQELFDAVSAEIAERFPVFDAPNVGEMIGGDF